MDTGDRVLVVSISQAFYSITRQLLHQIFDPYGEISYIDLFFPSNGDVQAVIEFQYSWCAVSAKNTLHGRKIYDGCCRMEIEFYNQVVEEKGVSNRKFVSQNADSVQDYVIRFEDWVWKNCDISEEYFVSIFISGLREEIGKFVLHCEEPTILARAIYLAKLQEDQLNAVRREVEYGNFLPKNSSPVEADDNKRFRSSPPSYHADMVLDEMSERTIENCYQVSAKEERKQGGAETSIQSPAPSNKNDQCEPKLIEKVAPEMGFLAKNSSKDIDDNKVAHDDQEMKQKGTEVTIQSPAPSVVSSTNAFHFYALAQPPISPEPPPQGPLFFEDYTDKKTNEGGVEITIPIHENSLTVLPSIKWTSSLQPQLHCAFCPLKSDFSGWISAKYLASYYMRSFVFNVANHMLDKDGFGGNNLHPFRPPSKPPDPPFLCGISVQLRQMELEREQPAFELRAKFQSISVWDNDRNIVGQSYCYPIVLFIFLETSTAEYKGFFEGNFFGAALVIDCGMSMQMHQCNTYPKSGIGTGIDPPFNPSLSMIQPIQEDSLSNAAAIEREDESENGCDKLLGTERMNLMVQPSQNQSSDVQASNAASEKVICEIGDVARPSQKNKFSALLLCVEILVQKVEKKEQEDEDEDAAYSKEFKLAMEHLKLLTLEVEDPFYDPLASAQLYDRIQLPLATGLIVYMKRMRCLLAVGWEVYIMMLRFNSLCAAVMVVLWLKRGVG